MKTLAIVFCAFFMGCSLLVDEPSGSDTSVDTIPATDTGKKSPYYPSYTAADTGPAIETDTGSNMDTGPAIETDTGSNMDTGPAIETDTGSNMDTGPAIETDTGSSMDTGPAIETDTGSSMDTGPAIETDTGLDTGPAVETDTGSSTDTGPAIETDTGLDTGPAIDTGSDPGTDTVDTGSDPGTDTADTDTGPDTCNDGSSWDAFGQCLDPPLWSSDTGWETDLDCGEDMRPILLDPKRAWGCVNSCLGWMAVILPGACPDGQTCCEGSIAP
jgi:hypothetical protein